MHAQIVLIDAFDPLDVIGPFEVLHAGSVASGGALSVELVCAEGPGEVVSGVGGLTLRATAVLDPHRPGLIIVPGAAGPLGVVDDDAEVDPLGADGDEAPLDGDEAAGAATIPVLLARTLDTALPELMRAALADPAVCVVPVCGGTLALAMAGLLEGRHAVTHHLGMDALAATGVITVDARVVDDGDLVSGGGVTSGLDVALYLLERELGPRIARAVEQVFAYERRGTVWRATGLDPVPM